MGRGWYAGRGAGCARARRHECGVSEGARIHPVLDRDVGDGTVRLGRHEVTALHSMSHVLLPVMGSH